MDKIVIKGERPLKGKVKISGAKNSALPILFASILTEGWNTFHNIPNLRDIQTTTQLLEFFGMKLKNGWINHTGDFCVTANGFHSHEAPYELVRTMRASVLALGPLLSRLGKAKVSLPGGCAIGARPINLHLKGLEQMGAKIEIEGGYVNATAKKLHGARVNFDTVTVTGTENLMMAATLADGETILENAAQEPEVVDLAHALIKMGARIDGAGTKTIRIEGVPELRGVEHTVIPDRVEAATFMMASAITGGNILIENTHSSDLESLIAKLTETGVKIRQEKEGLRVEGPKKLKAADITTAPFPGFATDFQAQFMACMTVAEGNSTITETIFENRFMHALEMIRMGANIKIEGKTAIVSGTKKLSGAPVMASDLRASAALILAGLTADGITEIHRVYHIDRGYEKIEKKLRKLGAKLKRVKVKY
ncbi:MAG: UDP-N-acetylglucosamine 1-carboxyvinyltransferase [Deltaproteobacteria bacterium]|nr:UDP-N-acetylglucosamine 1-carboxyvinyltransferase [Deltaproteobacteria bacterium]